MNTADLKLVDLARIIDRAGLTGFLEETARHYDSGLLVVDEHRKVVVRLNEAAGCLEVADLDTAMAASGSASVCRPVVAYGGLVGHVVARPASEEDGVATAALVEHVSNLLSELASREFELNDLSREILDSYEAVNLFYDVSSALPSAGDVGAVCSAILGKACEIIKVRRASILLLDPTSDDLVVRASEGLGLEELGSLRVPVADSISGWVLRSGTPRLVDDVAHLPDGLLRGYEAYATRSFMSVPLSVDSDPSGRSGNGCAIGVINMTDKATMEPFSSGDLKLLSALASQAAVLIRNIQLVEMEKELRIARTIQEGLLPSAPPEVPGLLVAGSCRPARNVGGDYFDFLLDSKTGRMATLVADVSGHNVASALLMAVARSALRGEIRSLWSPGPVLERSNRFLFEDLSQAESFLSVFCCVYEPRSRVLRFASAGHHPMLLHRAGDDECASRATDGLLLGIEQDRAFGEESVTLQPGDTVLLYTDGLVEARGAGGPLFGTDALARSLATHAHLPPDELLRALFDEILAFAGGRAPSDDMTAVVLKVF